jgi:predicted dehydrogenase
MIKDQEIKLGFIGCGGFGQFCLKAYWDIKEIKIVSVADINEKLAKQTAEKYHCESYNDPITLIEKSDVNLIHIATPPHLHFMLSREALTRNKHVICEKPLALSLLEADEIVSLAKEKGLILPVNFVLRYVPVVDLVRDIITSRILGEPLHANFENYATDEQLNQEHWFWDKSKSGGIFIEHGVHFFDLYNYWFGKPKVIYSFSEKRLGTQQEDRVTCLLKFKSGVVASHYHGFDQPGCLDRSTHKILFERGDINIRGWIPESVIVDTIVSNRQLEDLRNIFPDSTVTVVEEFDRTDVEMKGRGKSIRANKMIRLYYNSPLTKERLYAKGIESLVIDQIDYIKRKNHKRVITEKNGRDALALAVKASNLIRQQD